MIEHIGALKQLSGPALELSEIQLRRRRPRGGALKPSNSTRGHEHLPPADPRHEPNHCRELVGDVEPDDDISIRPGRSPAESSSGLPATDD